jgi:hypothetical protein
MVRVLKNFLDDTTITIAQDAHYFKVGDNIQMYLGTNKTSYHKITDIKEGCKLTIRALFWHEKLWIKLIVASRNIKRKIKGFIKRLTKKNQAVR